MSLKKTLKEVQEDLNNIHGVNTLLITEYRGREFECSITVSNCGCKLQPIYRSVCKRNYKFCNCKKIKDKLKELYPNYIINNSTNPITKDSEVVIEGVFNGIDFKVVRKVSSLLEGCFTPTKKELGILPKTTFKETLTENSYNLLVKKTARDSFIKECSNLYPHNDYFSIGYNGNKNKVTNILCKRHNIIFDCNYEARQHKSGLGVYCPICKEEQKIKNIETKRSEYVERFKEKHGDKYDYTDFIYKGSNTATTFICKEHGSFEQTPIGHLRSTFGCQICGAEASNGFGKQAYIGVCNGRESELYLIKIYNETETFYKIGITVEGVKSRFKNRKRLIGYKFEIIKTLKKDAEYIWNLEQEIHKKFRNTNYKYIPLNKLQGYTECYSSPEPFYKYFQ